MTLMISRLMIKPTVSGIKSVVHAPTYLPSITDDRETGLEHIKANVPFARSQQIASKVKMMANKLKTILMMNIQSILSTGGRA